jgi:hypothetical protein
MFVACGKSGEHASTAQMCVYPETAVPEFMAETAKLLQGKLEEAGFKSCTAKPHRMQAGATPIGWYCGEIAGTKVEASINRPGFGGCSLEVDLRADVSGSEKSISKRELPIMKFRDQLCDWFKSRAETVRRPSTSDDPGVSFSLGGNGAILGETEGPPACGIGALPGKAGGT